MDSSVGWPRGKHPAISLEPLPKPPDTVSGRSRFNCDFLSMSSGTTQEVVVYFWWDSACDTAGHLYPKMTHICHSFRIMNQQQDPPTCLGSSGSWGFFEMASESLAGTAPRWGEREVNFGVAKDAFPPRGPPRITSGFLEFNPREVVVSCLLFSMFFSLLTKMWFSWSITRRMGLSMRLWCGLIVIV